MSEYCKLLSYYETSVDLPQVSGFEILELLDVRSRLALAESQLNAAEKEQLERADDFLGHTLLNLPAGFGGRRYSRNAPACLCSHLALVVAFGEICQLEKNGCHGLNEMILF